MDGKPDQPRKGDITICAYCTEILEFDESLTPIKLTGETLDSFDQEALDDMLLLRNKLIEFNATKDGFPQQKQKMDY